MKRKTEAHLRRHCGDLPACRWWSRLHLHHHQLPSDTVAGYNNISVSGADISALNNTLSADGQYDHGEQSP